jgi:hypothetical protein
MALDDGGYTIMTFSSFVVRANNDTSAELSPTPRMLFFFVSVFFLLTGALPETLQAAPLASLTAVLQIVLFLGSIGVVSLRFSSSVALADICPTPDGITAPFVFSSSGMAPTYHFARAN